MADAVETADAAEAVVPAAGRPALFPRLFCRPRTAGLHALWMTALVAGGGMAGAIARAGVGELGTDPATGFPWITFGVNIAGCGAMGVLMAALHRVRRAPMWGGPVLGSGFLGGFTTFSSFAADTQRLLGDGHAGTGLLYAAGTVAGALAACAGGRALTAWLLHGRTRGDAP
ncbi:fluoride efflux transporter FluC [Actinacidiphila rubida]|uniref:Fluoride-specific ion channel FluC n=1 Tax=Actinacidiphila rubida TaxID=310780 RepID=A0A1H8JFJ4_9ACTN|nr:CrcB family protein [Actinacidiphila rubida]SEN79529.1 CrcB protein [Actinacidiphila rubida]